MPATITELLKRSEQSMRDTDGIHHTSVQHKVQVDGREGVVWEGDIWIDPDSGSARIEIYDPAVITGEESANGWFTAALMVHRDDHNAWVVVYPDRSEDRLTVPHRCIDVGQPLVSILTCVTTRGYLANSPEFTDHNPDWVTTSPFDISEGEFQGRQSIIAQTSVSEPDARDALFAFNPLTHALLGIQFIEDRGDQAEPSAHITSYVHDIIPVDQIDSACFDQTSMSIEKSCRSR